MTHPVKSPRKLIEVALPLDSVNAEAALRKRKAPAGYPTTLHKWWAQRPLAAARAVVFAQCVNDPGFQSGAGFRYGRNKKEAAVERARLFRIIEEIVLWENTGKPDVWSRAQDEIRRSWREICELNRDHPDAITLFDPASPPVVFDPFAGSGAIPLEAQRLGFETFTSDLNPVAVLISKASIEIPPRFRGRPPVGPARETKAKGKRLLLQDDWPGASGLAEDVRRYGRLLAQEAQAKIGTLFPSAEVTKVVAKDRPDLASLVGKKLDVVAWLWARTVRSPSPAHSEVMVPLASTYVLSSKKGREVYLNPVVKGRDYKFAVVHGVPSDQARDGTKLSRGANFKCLVSGTVIEPDHIKAEGIARRMGKRLGCGSIATVLDGSNLDHLTSLSLGRGRASGLGISPSA